MIVTQEFIVYAPRRSGHHAVIDALRRQVRGMTLFVNDGVLGNAPMDPANRNHFHFDWRLQFSSRVQKLIGSRLHSLPLPVTLIHNYEDSSPTTLLRARMLRTDATEMVVLRDPFNLMASRLKWHRDFLGQFEDISTQDLLEQLLDGFRVQVNMASFAKENSIPVIKYDLWLVDPELRVQYSNDLGGLRGPLEPSDQIAMFGPGSSFQGMDNVVAAQLNTTQRWREYTEDSAFRSVTLRSEFLEWSDEYFPDSEGLRWASRCT